jgi:hypothetical protein
VITVLGGNDELQSETYVSCIPEMGNGNWIYICSPRKLQVSKNANEIQELSMNTMTISQPDACPIHFGQLLRLIGAKLRRAFELSGGPYADGAMPPL